jgi:hypothetical protein
LIKRKNRSEVKGAGLALSSGLVGADTFPVIPRPLDNAKSESWTGR